MTMNGNDLGAVMAPGRGDRAELVEVTGPARTLMTSVVSHDLLKLGYPQQVKQGGAEISTIFPAFA
ncbi:hypothetical protein [Lentzea sp. NBRC 102530]|uniref:hypothetical protein n=1 Tax=Lentzea sp. NBRC 102530 TaxID=3032201 RepID=UPI00255311F6|nr:hypothetical protein [Lentzea sp. NBRC 102530]